MHNLIEDTTWIEKKIDKKRGASFRCTYLGNIGIALAGCGTNSREDS